jgi:hypothetical protein
LIAPATPPQEPRLQIFGDAALPSIIMQRKLDAHSRLK